MKKVLVGLGKAFYVVMTVLATVWWFYVNLPGSEASYLIRNESMFGALLYWWTLLLFTSKNSPFVSGKTADHTRSMENGKQLEENGHS